RIVKLGAVLDGGDGNVWEFTLNGNFAFSGLKTPHVDKPSEEDPDAALLEKLYLIEKLVKGLWSLLEAA
ncbi:MAG: hypothetical protein LBP61_05340, partial [Desulfovibrio sp.]|nr:hypothetical protein [Desulfovibrio sp.]